MPRDSETTKSDRELLEESAARARRTETRVTKIAHHLGIDVDTDQSMFDSQRRELYVPTRRVSLDDVIKAVGTCAMPVKVYCGDDLLMTVTRP